MDRLEQALRDTFADDRLDVLVRTDAISVIHSGVRRRRRNRQLVSAAAVAAVVVGSGAVVLTTSLTPTTTVATGEVSPNPTPSGKPALPQPTTTEVPWQNIGYEYTSPPAFPGAVPDPTVPWCTAAQLTMTTFFQGATGNSLGGVTMINTSQQPCSLQGEPDVRIVDDAGNTLIAHHAETFYVYPWVKLTPGQHAFAAIMWNQEFCKEPAPAAIQITLPHQGGTLTSTTTRPPRCNSSTDPASAGSLDVDGFGYDNAATAFTPQASLEAQVKPGPMSVVAGSTVTYHLLLSNNAPNPVDMTPCLPYRERLINQRTGTVIEEDHLLNCAAAPPSLAANQTLDFELKLSVPADAQSGDYLLLWQSVLKQVNSQAPDPVQVNGSPPACQDGQLAASAQPSAGSMMNQFGQVVVFTNTSSSACSLRGYPGLQLVDGAGRAMTVPLSRGGGYVFADPDWTTVVLAASGGQASFTFGGEASDMAHGGTPCPQAAGIRVIPPGDRQQLAVAIGVPACPAGLDVAKVVTGPAGSHF